VHGIITQNTAVYIYATAEA